MPTVAVTLQAEMRRIKPLKLASLVAKTITPLPFHNNPAAC